MAVPVFKDERCREGTVDDGAAHDRPAEVEPHEARKDVHETGHELGHALQVREGATAVVLEQVARSVQVALPLAKSVVAHFKDGKRGNTQKRKRVGSLDSAVNLG